MLINIAIKSTQDISRPMKTLQIAVVILATARRVVHDGFEARVLTLVRVRGRVRVRVGVRIRVRALGLDLVS